MITPLKNSSVVALLALLPFSALNGSTIQWSSQLCPVSGFQGGSLDAGVFSQAGSVFYAENSGGLATTFDSISFAAGDPALLPSGGDYGGFHGGINTTLAQTGRYDESAAVMTLGDGNMGPLVVGQAYLVQLLVADGRGGAAGRQVWLDGINQGQYANAVGAPDYSWGSVMLVSGTFSADATAQSFTLENFDSTGASVGAQYNAVLIRAVPEASSLSLGGLAALAFLRRRRRAA